MTDDYLGDDATIALLDYCNAVTECEESPLSAEQAIIAAIEVIRLWFDGAYSPTTH